MRYLLSDLVILILVVQAEAAEEIFQTFPYVERENNSITTLSNTNNVGCAINCVDYAECIGFLFDQSDSRCHLLSCVNPTLNSTSSDSVTAYAQISLTANRLLARNKPATVSQDYQPETTNFIAGKANDGIYRPEGSETASIAVFVGVGGEGWWRVDLEQVRCIWALNILNRGDAPHDYLWERMRDAVVSAGLTVEEINNNICGTYDGMLNQYYTLITCVQPVRGQFVQLLFQYSGDMNLYEVEVHGV